MNIPNWTVELHTHTKYSKDSLLRIEDIPDICRARGIDKVAVTDHNVVEGALAAARLFPMLVIPGVEIMTTQGELLAWYVSELVPHGLTPMETIERLRGQGAVIGVAHPFDRYRRGAWAPDDLLAITPHVDAIEILNSRCLKAEDNDQALAFAEQHGKTKVVGSDAHTPREYGCAVMKMEPFANTAEGLKAALETATWEGRINGMGVHFSSTYAKWLKRIIPGLRPK